MTEDSKCKKAKLVYEKPKLREIELAADEVLAVGCKVQNKGQNGFRNRLPSCWVPRHCYARGS